MGMTAAQTVLVNAPADLAGDYAFAAADFGADLLTDIWTGDAEFIDDGSGADASQGCGPAVNDLTGKIALIDRGSCEFGTKALNAENAGAIGAIIFNNNPGEGPVGMAPGAEGGSVTIPTVMLSYEDGQTIRAALETGVVNITIGNIVFENDLRLTPIDVLMAPAGIYPITQIENPGDFVFVPGAAANNFGTLDAEGFTVDATITHMPFGGSATEVYDETASSTEVVPSDTFSNLLTLTPFDPIETGTGVYDFTYDISNPNAEDETPGDNTLSSSFTISQNLLSKASWDPATGRPNVTIYRTSSGGGEVEFLTFFTLPYGEGFIIDSILVDVAANDPILGGVLIEAFIYEWIDADGDSVTLNDEVGLVGLASATIPDEYDETTAALSMKVTDLSTFEPVGYTIPADGITYIIGVKYTGTDLIFFGFDETYDYNQYIDYTATNNILTNDAYGYLLVSDRAEDGSPDFEGGLGLFQGVPGNAASTGVILTPIEISTEDIVGEDVFEMNLFPNPTTDLLTATLNFKQDTRFAEYRITGVDGKVLFMTRDNEILGQEQAAFNVKNMAAGQYFLTVRTEQGIQTKPFVVKR